MPDRVFRERIPRAARSEELPLSRAEEALWLAHQGRSGTNAYNESLAYRLTDPDLPALHAAVMALVDRHEVLRTSFHSSSTGLARRIHGSSEFGVASRDLSTLPTSADRQAAAMACLADQHELHFDLAAGPLFRCVIAKLSDGLCYVGLTIHHIVSDFVTTRIIETEFLELYRRLRLGDAPPCANQEIEYADYAAWQRRRLTPLRLESLWSYWRQQLRGVPLCHNLPLDRARRAPFGMGGRETFLLPAPVRELVAAFARRSRTTIFVVLLTVFALLLHKKSNDPHVVIGLLMQNRNRTELRTMVGLFLDLIAIKADFSEQRSFSAFLQEIHATVIQGYEHVEMPIGLLMERLGHRLDALHTPLFQVMFNFMNASLRTMDRPQISDGARGLHQRNGAAVASNDVEPVVLDWECTAKYDLIMNIAEGDGLFFFLTYNTELFQSATIRAWGRDYVALLHRAITSPEANTQDYAADHFGRGMKVADWIV